MNVVRKISSIVIAAVWIIRLLWPATMSANEIAREPDWSTTIAQAMAITIALSWPWWLVRMPRASS
jgi:hypothetical protein